MSQDLGGMSQDYSGHNGIGIACDRSFLKSSRHGSVRVVKKR